MTKSILKAFCYADVFDYPLTRGEAYQFFIGPKPLTKPYFATSLKVLIKQHFLVEVNVGRVGETNKFICLKNRQSIVKKRLNRHTQAKPKQKIAIRVGKWLKKIPTIHAVYVTGSLALSNTKAQDDIDLMIITNPGRLWSTRLVTTSLLEALKVRRKPEDNHSGRAVSDKICPNIYLDSSHLSVPTDKQNLYTAHEVIQANLLWDKHATHHQFLRQNSWVTSYLPHSPLPPVRRENYKKNKSSLNLLTQGSEITERLAYKTQIWYMKNRLTKETVTPGAALFHPRDTANLVLTAYRHRLKKFNLTP